MLLDAWKRTFGKFAPLGYVCREKLPSRWLRIHSLPKSKRYPQTEAEYRELLRRHNEVATDLLGEGDECALFVDEDGRWITWNRGQFDSLIRSVADENAGRVLFANFQRQTIYAPYDGGADLIVATPAHVALKRMLWRDWLSSWPDGL